MARTAVFIKWIRGGRYLVMSLAFTVGVVLLLLWLAGKFSPKVPSAPTTTSASAMELQGDEELMTVRFKQEPTYESAVGTVQAVHETTIGSKLLANVMEVNVTAGQKVRTGQVLIRLDDTDLKAKLAQARETVTSIEANRAQLDGEEKRYAKLLPQKAISLQQYEKTVAALRATEADLRRAGAALNEVQAALDWATIRSPLDGTVFDKKVNVGDMVTPGQILVTLFDPKRMQLVASVRESLVHRLHENQDIGVKIDPLEKQCVGTISEIVPEAHTNSRSFQVKVTGPCPPNIYSGMSGQILIPLGEENMLVIPSQAIQSVGQMQFVNVVQGNQVVRRAIRTGRQLGTNGDEVEVVSGLREGEQIVVPRSATSNSTREAVDG